MKATELYDNKTKQKSNGAFYTPLPYVKLITEYLLEYIKELDTDKYIIIDRAAGSGNLFKCLPDNILSKCWLNSIEEFEINEIKDYFKDKLLGVSQYNALSFEVIPELKEYIDNEDYTIIMLENPPFSEVGSDNIRKEKRYTQFKDSLICKNMKNEINGKVTNDICNLFVWSCFKYYLRKETDSYFLIAPIKYWKTQHIISKEPYSGFITNRKHYGATEAGLPFIQWLNKDSNIECFNLDAIDIDKNGNVINCGSLDIKKVYDNLSKAYDKRKFDDDTEYGILCEANGLEFNNNGRKVSIKKYFNENILSYMNSCGYDPDPKNVNMVRCGIFNGHGFFVRKDNYKEKLPLFNSSIYEYKRNYIAYLDSHSFSIKSETCNLTIDVKYDSQGFRLRKDNYKEKLPLFQAGSYTRNNWFEKTIINKTYDGNGSYINDTEFIKRCFIHTCLSFKNKCRSLWGSNGKLYLNNLCFDTDTIASKDLLKYELNDYEKDMIEDYYKILEFIKTTEEYKEEYKYGLFQIREEINIKDDNKKLKYPDLDKMLKDIKKKIDTYYIEYIVNDLFKYELLK